MGTVVEEITKLIQEYETKPDEVVIERLEEITDVLDSLSNNSTNSLYMYLAKERIVLLTNPTSWINKQIQELYLQLFKEDTTLGAKKIFLCKQVDKYRDKLLFKEKIPYQFPNGIEHIQLRDERDRQNIQDNVASAQADLLDNNPSEMHVFMVRSNIPQFMTAKQISDMGRFLKRRGDALYTKAWEHKINIRTLTIKDELEHYDITLGWPEEEYQYD